MQLPSQAGGSPVRLSAPHPLAANTMHGTVGATLEVVDDWSYGSLSDNWVRGARLAVVPDPPIESALPRLCAKDLIAEIDAISAQIHRIMFQVERAVSRLATSG